MEHFDCLHLPPGDTPEELIGPLNEVERKNAPARLEWAGDVLLLRGAPRVAIVGSRRPPLVALGQARSLAAALAGHGVTVVSGLAEGIDTAAHLGAIAAGGRTIAVLGTPMGEVFPEDNRQLQQVMMREHLVVSQFAAGTPVKRGNFPMRNRTMALIADASVIVAAGKKSGALHHGWEALRLGRPLFLFESLLNAPTLAWPAEMLRYGAHPFSPDRLDLLLEHLPESSRVAPSELTF